MVRTHFNISTRFCSWKAFGANFAPSKLQCSSTGSNNKITTISRSSSSYKPTNKQTGFSSADRQLRLKAKGRQSSWKKGKPPKSQSTNAQTNTTVVFLLWLREFYANYWGRGNKHTPLASHSIHIYSCLRFVRCNESSNKATKSRTIYIHTHTSILYCLQSKILECFYLADDVTYLFWFWSQNVRHTLNLIITMGFPQLHGLFRGFETIFWERRAGRRCRWRLFTIRFCSAILHTGLHCAGDQCCRWHVDLAGKWRAFRKSNFCK